MLIHFQWQIFIQLAFQKFMLDTDHMGVGGRGMVASNLVIQLHHNSFGLFSESLCLPAAFLLHACHASRVTQAIIS